MTGPRLKGGGLFWDGAGAGRGNIQPGGHESA